MCQSSFQALLGGRKFCSAESSFKLALSQEDACRTGRTFQNEGKTVECGTKGVTVCFQYSTAWVFFVVGGVGTPRHSERVYTKDRTHG